MAIPTYDHFIEPLLRYLAKQKEPISTKQVYKVMVEQFGLTADDMAELLPSEAMPIYKNRICWAHDRLKRAGYSESPRRGYWLLTKAGREYEKSHSKLGVEDIKQIARVVPGSRASHDDENVQSNGEAVSSLPAQSAQERIDTGVREIHESLINDLLEVIGRGSPDFFEQLVLDVLHALGYGTSRQDLQRVGRSGDGGIDGIISLDRLGLEKVYVQAKKWQGLVGSPQVQGFMGALQLQGADKGVLITSGKVSRPALEAAKQARGCVVLIDGIRLASLMIEHGVGVSHKEIRLPKIDMDYFEDE